MIIRVLSGCVHTILCTKEVDMSDIFGRVCQFACCKHIVKKSVIVLQIVQSFLGDKVVLQLGVGLYDTKAIHGF